MSCMQSNGCPLQKMYFYTLFPLPPTPTYSLAICPQQKPSHCSSALTEEETLFLGGHPERLGSPFCPQLPVLTASHPVINGSEPLAGCADWKHLSCPTGKDRWGSCPSPRPFHHDSHSPDTGCILWTAPGSAAQCEPCSAPAALNKAGRNLTWVFLTWSHQMGIKQRKEVKQLLGNHHCHSGSTLQGSRLPPFMSVVPQINKHRDTSKGIWLLSEACWLMISAKRLLCGSQGV